jgi:hypothetical protein
VKSDATTIARQIEAAVCTAARSVGPDLRAGRSRASPLFAFYFDLQGKDTPEMKECMDSKRAGRVFRIIAADCLQPDLGSTFAASDFFWSRSPSAFTRVA